MIPNFFQKIICCPNCQKELVINQESLVCPICQKTYPLVKGVPVFTNINFNQDEPTVGLPADNPFRYALHFWLNKKYLRQYLKPQANDFILDIGCGLGHYLDFLSRFSKNLAGLDTDLPSAFYAQNATPANCVLGQAEKLPFQDDSFDKIINFMVLEHLQDDQKAIKEMQRVGKNKATILIMVPALEGPRAHSKLKHLMHDSGNQKHFRDGYYAAEIKKLLQDNGIRVMAMRHTVFIGAELFAELTKLFYSKKYKTYQRQTDLFKVANSKLFSLYKSIIPLIGQLALLEDWLFARSKRGHTIVIRGEIQK